MKPPIFMSLSQELRRLIFELAQSPHCKLSTLRLKTLGFITPYALVRLGLGTNLQILILQQCMFTDSPGVGDLKRRKLAFRNLKELRCVFNDLNGPLHVWDFFGEFGADINLKSLEF
ncbi:hypothetical protein CPB84DRAFT_1753564 [Gymnopilus junonius]|uniref:Uncharacterized protein n=1 Tax=Gymnopilus junonius TaxID=109634 RepID=A0A9P5N7W8_GYMJU|nr:hypothetical protein CPB84DRAFT_1753564 [Gymnopilus junonius]